MSVTVVVRTRDDEEFLFRTLSAIRRESPAHRIVVMNNNSNNRSLRKECRALVDEVVSIPDGSYRPGRVLNKAMRITKAEVVVFLNADCIPQRAGWLESLIEPMNNSSVGATFGCQTPRPGCFPPLARDTVDTFGNGQNQRAWRHCFSMACSAVRRDAWEQIPFSESLRYSEDIAWSYTLKSEGFQVAYVPEAVVEHSHNYSLNQFYRRQRGEGEAEAKIFTWNQWRSSLVRYSLLPLLKQVLRDTKYCFRNQEFSWIFRSVPYRVMGALGRRHGFLKGRS